MGDDTLVNGQVIQPPILDLDVYRRDRSLPETAQRLHEKCVTVSRQVGVLSIELGCYLWEMREHRLFEPLGYEDFNSYLRSPDLGMSRQHLYKLIRIAEVFCPHITQPAGSTTVLDSDDIVEPEVIALAGVTKANLVARYVQDHPEEAREWISRAAVLTETDLQLALLEAQDPAMTQMQGAAFELGKKLAAIAYHLSGTRNNPIPILDELIDEAQRGRAWLATVIQNGPRALPVESEEDAGTD